jgi:hypothetical protein
VLLDLHFVMQFWKVVLIVFTLWANRKSLLYLIWVFSFVDCSFATTAI